MRKRSGQVHSRESSATLQLTVSLLYPFLIMEWYNQSSKSKYEGEILWSKLQNVNL